MFNFYQMIVNLGPIIFALAAFGIAAYVYAKKKRDQPMVCPLNGHCDLVTRSRYSKFLGIPVEFIGMVFDILIIFIYTTNYLIPGIIPDIIFFLVIGIAFGAFIFCLYLIIIQAFVLKKWCTWCLFSAGFSTLIFITVLLGSQIDTVALLSQYKIVLIVLHALAAAIGLGAATVSDIFFFRFLKDYRISQNEHEMMETLSNVIWFALGLIVITGIGLFIPKTAVLLVSSKFLIKMVVVGVLIINGVFLNLMISPKLMLITFEEVVDNRVNDLHILRRLSFALGAVSISSWYLVFILGLLPSIPISFHTALLVYLLILCIAMFVSQLLDAKMIRDYKNKGLSGENNNPSL
jgi:uncharacterized membrane protein